MEFRENDFPGLPGRFSVWKKISMYFLKLIRTKVKIWLDIHLSYCPSENSSSFGILLPHLAHFVLGNRVCLQMNPDQNWILARDILVEETSFTTSQHPFFTLHANVRFGWCSQVVDATHALKR
jgi:hypothetical protein